MPEIGTSGSTSGDGKRRVAAWPKRPRPSSTLPKRTFRDVRYLSAFRGKADIAPARNDLGQPGAARSCGRPAKAMMSYRARSLRANVAGSAWIFEAADG